MASPKVLIPMADYDHDPTGAGVEVYLATEDGKIPECDRKILDGITQKLPGTTAQAVKAYYFSLDGYNLVFLPGGHEKSVRQLIDSPIILKHLASFFPAAKKPSLTSIAAVCHGVMVLSETEVADCKSVIYNYDTTALPARFEQVAFWGTRLFMGDYYKTYGAGLTMWKNLKLANPDKQYKNSLGMGPFVVEDKNHNYISARFPCNAELLAEKVITLVKASTS
ncbi:class I glutamine amidotransferase-like protein [Calycina marina]|uniref:Class I glutamine amidotransferase-like protein n=1 Tax=Calycina marina TaxID=1763456 RepID=A0A9P8CCZ2_9HELO|nr:class I glutamine amidotransferase-like protein [Calycina marina]